MTEYFEVEVDTFFNAVEGITYRAQDVQEAIQFGCTDIIHCFKQADKRFGRYFLVVEDNVPIVTVMLQRNGHIIFFISDTVNNKIALIRALKKLANDTVNCCGAIITKTAYWYDEAQKLNKVIGFKPYQKYDYFGFYVKERDGR